MAGKEVAKGFLTKLIPKPVMAQLKSLLLFRPNDEHNLLQVPPQKYKSEGVPRIQGYRYPAPGSRAEVPRIPTVQSEDTIYDIKYFGKDVRRAPQDRVSITPGVTQPSLLEGGFPKKEEAGSPGRPNPAVAAYDSTGLRSAMTATHEAMNAELAKHAPTQLVRFEWEARADEIVADYQSKGLPPVPGQAPKMTGYSENAYVQSW
mmetsp:Transcript_4606/g.6058  ORF Transcript_4606/g.6058 Transcript_4606/m.6058 type:complete len:204 (-) Transcript_4606:331-942(-)